MVTPDLIFTLLGGEWDLGLWSCSQHKINAFFFAEIVAVSDAECGEDTLVTAPRHPADNTISNICSAEIQMGCHLQVGVLLNPWWFWNILRVTCRPRPRHNHHYQHFICRRISSWFGPDCCPPPGPSVRWVLGGGDLFNYKVSQLHSYNTQHISHRITQRSATALSPPPTQLMASLTTGAIITIVIIIAVVGIKLNWTQLIWTNWWPSHDLDI